MAGAQFVDSFTIEAEIAEENSSGTTTAPTSSGSGVQSGTRVDRDDDVVPVGVPNVRNIRITPSGSELNIEWDNPAVDFASIRVIKGDFFAKDIYDGWTLFNAVGEAVFDARPGEVGVFYTFFVVMPDGRTSSGVSTFYKEEEAQVPKEPPSTPKEPEPLLKPLPPLEPLPEPPPPDFWDAFRLDGVQREGMIRSIDDIFVTPFSAQQDITFVIPAYAIPSQMKSIVLTLENKETGVFERFLLRRQGNEFTAEVPRRLIAGRYTVYIDLYDFDALNRMRHQRTIDIYPHYFVSQDDKSGQVLLMDYIIIVYVLLAIFLLALLGRLWVVIKRPAV